MGSCPRVCFHSFFFYLVPPRKGSALSLLVPLLHPDARAHRAVGFLEEDAVLRLLSLLGRALVELVVASVTVASLVRRREPLVVRRGSQLNFDLGLGLLLLLLWCLRKVGTNTSISRRQSRTRTSLALLRGARVNPTPPESLFRIQRTLTSASSSASASISSSGASTTASSSQ